MPPDGSSFTPLNLPSTFSLPQCMEYFSLTAGPNTNLWRKPPTGDIATAPIVFTSLRNSFVVAEVTAGLVTWGYVKFADNKLDPASEHIRAMMEGRAPATSTQKTEEV